MTRFATFVIVCSALGCSGENYLVARGPAPEKGPKAVRVGYPPPPAKVEYIPLRRRDECRYQDGHFTSQGGAWVWKPGLWVVENPDCYYVEPETKFEATPQGRLLMHRPGGYFEKKAPHKACKLPAACDSVAESAGDLPKKPAP